MNCFVYQAAPSIINTEKILLYVHPVHFPSSLDYFEADPGYITLLINALVSILQRKENYSFKNVISSGWCGSVD